MKKIILFFLGCSLLSCDDFNKTKQNYENVKKIRMRMQVNQVRQIMGNPETVEESPYTNEHFRLKYDSPPGMSDFIYISFNRNDSTVVGINDGS